MTAMMAPGSTAQLDDSSLLVDFPESLRELSWRVVNDDVMGGRSEGGLRPGEQAIVFTGVTDTNGGGFSSIRSETRRFDLAASDGVRLRVRGDGRTYTFRVTTASTRRDRLRPSYWADFPTGGEGWEVVDVPFRRFRPRWRGRWLEGPALDTSAIDSLGLMIYDDRDGPFRLEVDWIRAYREPAPFSLSGFRWQKRPLLLFAPERADARLRRQLSAIEASRDRFDERDMVLIVVLGAGRSSAGDRELTADDADHLRARYGVDRSSFALRLIGKDGGVKRRSEDPLPADVLYEQIDAMPMRQEEIRRERDDERER